MKPIQTILVKTTSLSKNNVQVTERSKENPIFERMALETIVWGNNHFGGKKQYRNVIIQDFGSYFLVYAIYDENITVSAVYQKNGEYIRFAKSGVKYIPVDENNFFRYEENQKLIHYQLSLDSRVNYNSLGKADKIELITLQDKIAIKITAHGEKVIYNYHNMTFSPYFTSISRTLDGYDASLLHNELIGEKVISSTLEKENDIDFNVSNTIACRINSDGVITSPIINITPTSPITFPGVDFAGVCDMVQKEVNDKALQNKAAYRSSRSKALVLIDLENGSK